MVHRLALFTQTRHAQIIFLQCFNPNVDSWDFVIYLVLEPSGGTKRSMACGYLESALGDVLFNHLWIDACVYSLSLAIETGSSNIGVNQCFCKPCRSLSFGLVLCE